MSYRVLANEIETELSNIDTLHLAEMHVPSLSLMTFRGEGPGGRKGGTGGRKEKGGKEREGREGKRREGRKEKGGKEREGREKHSVYVANSLWTSSGRFKSRISLTTVFFHFIYLSTSTCYYTYL